MEVFISWLLYILCPLVLFIWLYYVRQLGNDSPIHYVNAQERRTEMMSIHNPFTFFFNKHTAGYSVVECIISSEVEFFVVPLWGVPIIEVFKLMGGEWRDLKNSVLDVKFQDKCVCACNPSQNSPCVQKHLEFSPCSKKRFRNCFENYPLVVLMIREEDLNPPDKVQVVALVTIIHLKNDIVDIESKILDQYSKLSNGKLINIQKIFTSSPESDILYYACVVCHERSVNRVILPCRHACICDICFKRLDMCPVCRGPLQTYFSLQGVPPTC